MSKKKISIYLIVIAIVIAMLSLSTYSWYKWHSSSNNTISVALSGGSRITFIDGPDISDSLTPVANYYDGIVKTFKVSSDGPGNTFDLYLKINTIPNELKDASFKWAIYKDDAYINGGDFSTCNDGDDVILLDDRAISFDTEDVYTIYFWIDSLEENDPGMSGKTVDFNLYAIGNSAGDSFINTLVQLPKAYMIMARKQSSETSPLFNSPINANQVNSLTFTTIDNKPSGVTTTDVSDRTNSGEVLMWYTENGTTQGDNPITLYDVFIASSDSSSPVYSAYNSTFLFANLVNCKSIDLSNLDTRYTRNMYGMFYNLRLLTSLDLSGFNTSNTTSMGHMFDECRKLNTIDISNFDLSNVVTCRAMFQYDYAATNIVMPSYYTRIDNFMFNHNGSYSASSFVIPASVSFVGYTHIFYNFGSSRFTSFEVENGNNYVKSVDGILYSYDGTRLISIPCAKTFTNNTYTIPEGVTELNELSFSNNYNIKTVVIPNSYIIERDNKAFASSKGYLNGGNSLNGAVYRYTSVEAYSVNNDNPNYMSYNGCIYSKDGTELIAVPLHYRGALNIKEGTTTIGLNAFTPDDYSFYNELTGISIPSSVTTINNDQLTVINKIVTTKNISVTVDANNAAYQVTNNSIVAK